MLDLYGTSVAAIAFPLRIAWTPVSYAARLLKTLLAPTGYLLHYLSTCVAALAAFLASLEPLFTFFSVAAFVGVVAGILAATLSGLLTTHLGMYDAPVDSRRRLKTDYLDEYLAQPLPLPQPRRWGDHISRFRVSRLQGETIHEEDDSE
ncbi:uncharacterized protein UV8b_03135 [Ustilaginoidea virens]|uniref:Uncharacterized protein n=1 Tax=Ustilaginoidea virens TaxID=1159556 RepID=A0A8E5HP19_USTVR|nr:uncharacterized protein UV8b_03135 [Ustilaginoidea virens]QUC18894.1 hypothetical protein UV8b_03135 [Ustilaginoidea virens]